jgi:hypothetical protein
VALGFIFGVGALGTLTIGYMADGVAAFSGIGLETAFQTISGFVLASALLGFFLPVAGGRTQTPSTELQLEPEGAD